MNKKIVFLISLIFALKINIILPEINNNDLKNYVLGFILTSLLKDYNDADQHEKVKIEKEINLGVISTAFAAHNYITSPNDIKLRNMLATLVGCCSGSILHTKDLVPLLLYGYTISYIMEVYDFVTSYNN